MDADAESCDPDAAARGRPDGDWSTLFDRLPVGAYRCALDGRLWRANPALVRLNGYARETELIDAVRDIGAEWYVDPARRAAFQALLARDGQVTGFVSEVYRHRTRERIWVSENAYLVRDGDGRVWCYEGTVEEVSSRVRAEQAAEASAALLRGVTAGVPGMLYRVQLFRDGRQVYHFVSEGVQALYGLTPAQVLADGRLLQRYRHPDDRAAYERELWPEALAGRTMSAEFRIQPVGGGTKWVRMSSRQVSADADSVLRDGMVLDITDSRQAEQALRDADAHWRRAFDSIGDGLWEIDLAQGVIALSGPLQRAYGWPSASQPTASADVDQRVHPDDRDSMLRARREHLEGRAPIYQHEHRIQRADGSWMWVLTRGLVIERDAAGRPLRAIGTHTDVTERREAQALREQRDRAEAADRAKSALMSRISHELRTPLNAVLGFAQLLAHDGGLTARQAQWNDQVIASGRHLLALVDDVLELARAQGDAGLGLALGRVDVHTVFDEAWQMQAMPAQTAGLTLRRAPGPWPAVRADAKRLRQVLGNLLSNAIKYNRPGGAVEFDAVADGDGVRVSVGDTGPGIDPALRDRLFQPFDRLGAERGSVPGTGLGLALSRQLSEAMGGHLTVAARAGGGSVFTLWLPAAAPAEPG